MDSDGVPSGDCKDGEELLADDVGMGRRRPVPPRSGPVVDDAAMQWNAARMSGTKEPPNQRARSEPPMRNVPWTDPRTDEVIAAMRAAAPLSAMGGQLKAVAGEAFISGSIDIKTNTVTVYWHGPRPAAAETLVRQGQAAGITVTIVDAPFSADQLAQSRERLTQHGLELGISKIDFDNDGRGSTVHFPTRADIQAARDALVDYEKQLDQITDDHTLSAAAALHSPPGSPEVRISEQMSNPQTFAGEPPAGQATD